eukprot:GDKJ01030863.1.p1 GENE.GDKJ01030863.1~~GDKJ01030863.1.p1  ORF type:complete len:461 (+),score=93.60 GDKJ01030863.1:13-1395(+)
MRFVVLCLLVLCGYSLRSLEEQNYNIFHDIYYYFKDAFTPIAVPSGAISDVVPTVEQLNADVILSEPILQRLKNRTFFRIFKVDLSKECPFWAAAAMCNNPEYCHVCECEENEIPWTFKQKPIEEFVDKRHGKFKEWSPVRSHSSLLGMMKDESTFTLETSGEDSSKATYVDLMYNRPGYTSYRGGSVWRLVYEENCNFNEGCSEGDDYRRLISGMQSNIAALAAEYFDKANNYNVRWFFEKLGPHRERIENLYFTYGVLLRTACLVAPILEDIPFDTGNERDDRAARADILQLLNTTFASCDQPYLENHIFHETASAAISQIQNVTKMLDCVECEKCRLHGKLKLTALQLAIREASSNPVDQIQKLERNEVTALINALAYFSHSIKVIFFFEERMTTRRRLILAGAALFFLVLSLIAKCFVSIVRKRKQRKHQVKAETAEKRDADEEAEKELTNLRKRK